MFVTKGPVDNEMLLAWVMAWRHLGNKQLTELMLTEVLHYHMRSLGHNDLTHHDLVTPYGDIVLGQHWPR